MHLFIIYLILRQNKYNRLYVTQNCINILLANISMITFIGVCMKLNLLLKILIALDNLGVQFIFVVGIIL